MAELSLKQFSEVTSLLLEKIKEHVGPSVELNIYSFSPEWFCEAVGSSTAFFSLSLHNERHQFYSSFIINDDYKSGPKRSLKGSNKTSAEIAAYIWSCVLKDEARYLAKRSEKKQVEATIAGLADVLHEHGVNAAYDRSRRELELEIPNASVRIRPFSLIQKPKEHRENFRRLVEALTDLEFRLFAGEDDE